MSVSKERSTSERTYEQAIVCMTRAEKRQSILAILFEEANYLDIVEESGEIVRSAIEGLLCHAGLDPGIERQLPAQLRGAMSQLDPKGRDHALDLAAHLEELYGWRDYLAASGAPPDRIQAAQMIDWATEATRLIQSVVKDIDDRF